MAEHTVVLNLRVTVEADTRPDTPKLRQRLSEQVVFPNRVNIDGQDLEVKFLDVEVQGQGGSPGGSPGN